MGVNFPTLYWLDDADTIMSSYDTGFFQKFTISTGVSEKIETADVSELKPPVIFSYSKYFPQTRCFIAASCWRNTSEFVSYVWQRDANKWVTVYATLQSCDDYETACPWQNNSFVLFFRSGKISLCTVFPTFSSQVVDLGPNYTNTISSIEKSTLIAYKDFIVFITFSDLIFYHVPSSQVSFTVPHLLQTTKIASTEYGDYILLLKIALNVPCVFHIFHVPTRQWTLLETLEQIKYSIASVFLMAGFNKIHVKGTMSSFCVDFLKEEQFQKRMFQEGKLRNVTIVFD